MYENVKRKGVSHMQLPGDLVTQLLVWRVLQVLNSSLNLKYDSYYYQFVDEYFSYVIIYVAL